MKMDAIVLAGGIMARKDPLYSEGLDGRRCLIDIHGKPMVQWVIDALVNSQTVGDIYIIGLPQPYGLTAPKPLHFLPGAGGLFENIHTGVISATAKHPSQSKVLIASADIPAIQPEMVDWLTGQVAKDPTAMLYYNVIPQVVMEQRYPNANRSFVRFKDIAVCGGDLNVVDISLFAEEQPIWHQLAEARKHPLRQVRLLGLDSLILVVLHLVTLEGAVRRVCKKLAVEARALVNPYAEMGMDADKPHQLEILRQDLEKAF